MTGGRDAPTSGSVEPRAAGEMGVDAPTLYAVTSYGSVPLGFARRRDAIYLIARERTARWPIELLRTGRATVVLPTGRVTGVSCLVTDPTERKEVLELFLGAYGEQKFARWYDHPARMVRVDLDRIPPRADATGGTYYRWLESEFDNVAEGYDHHITGNRMNRLLRDRSLSVLRPLFRSERRLLEIGCGSGMETLPILAEGHEVVVIDISQRMLDVVREKATREGVRERLTLHKLRARDLGRLVDDLGEGTIDGAYSTYGALNCEPDLAPLPPALHRLLRPAGRFLAGIYNRWCLFEMVGYTLAFQWGRAFGRRRHPVPVGTSRFCIDVYAYSPREVERQFEGLFEVERVEGVPALLPPSDLTQYAEKYARHFDTLARWDAWVGLHTPLARFGDHFLMTLRARRTGHPPVGRHGDVGKDVARAPPPDGDPGGVPAWA
ncbi:MAG: class I SAM-dependent methyltransferase [Thermoplasmata archaeon]